MALLLIAVTVIADLVLRVWHVRPGARSVLW